MSNKLSKGDRAIDMPSDESIMSMMGADPRPSEPTKPGSLHPAGSAFTVDDAVNGLKHLADDHPQTTVETSEALTVND